MPNRDTIKRGAKKQKASQSSARSPSSVSSPSSTRSHSESSDWSSSEDGNSSDVSDTASSIVNIDFDFTSLQVASIPHYKQLVKGLLAPICVERDASFALKVAEAFSQYLIRDASGGQEQGWLNESKGTAIVQADEEASSDSDNDDEQAQKQAQEQEQESESKSSSAPTWPLAFLSVVPLQALQLAPSQQAVFEAWLARCNQASSQPCSFKTTHWLIKCASVNNLPTQLLFPLYNSLFSQSQKTEHVYLILVKTLYFISQNEKGTKKKKSSQQSAQVDYFSPEDSLLASFSFAFVDLKVMEADSLSDAASPETSDLALMPSKGFEDMEYTEGRRLFLIHSAQLLRYIQALKAEFDMVDEKQQ